MNVLFSLPKLLSGPGVLAELPAELEAFGVRRPMLISDAGLNRAGLVSTVAACLQPGAVIHPHVGENPTCADADAAFSAYVAGNCDGIVALGGGSVLDTAKFLAAMVYCKTLSAAQLLGRSDLIGASVPPLVAIPTTVGTGSESSPATGLHPDPQARAVGTRSPFLIPKVVICDAEMALTLPPRLIAATGVDALSHCLEGYLARTEHPVIDAIALDGLARAKANLHAATQGNLESLQLMMVASFAGGVSIQKGLGPAHAIALACGDQHLHHGTLVAAAMPSVMDLLASRLPEKTARVAEAVGLASGRDLGPMLRELNRSLGLPDNLRELGYRVRSMDVLVDAMAASPFNRTAGYAPTRAEYLALAGELTA